MYVQSRIGLVGSFPSLSGLVQRDLRLRQALTQSKPGSRSISNIRLHLTASKEPNHAFDRESSLPEVNCSIKVDFEFQKFTIERAFPPWDFFVGYAPELPIFDILDDPVRRSKHPPTGHPLAGTVGESCCCVCYLR